MASVVGEVQEAERGGGESQGDGVWEARNGWQTTRLFCPAVGKETRPRPPTHFFLKTHPLATPQATHPPNIGQTREEIISAWPSAQWAQQPEPTHPLSQTPQGLHGKDVERKPRTEGQKMQCANKKGNSVQVFSRGAAPRPSPSNRGLPIAAATAAWMPCSAATSNAPARARSASASRCTTGPSGAAHVAASHCVPLCSRPQGPSGWADNVTNTHVVGVCKCAKRIQLKFGK